MAEPSAERVQRTRRLPRPTVAASRGVLINNLELLLDIAGQAPSPMNSRPWRFRARAGGVDMLADPCDDPTTRRQRLVGCGAALFNLRLAASHLGVEPSVTVLPDGQTSDLLARLEAGPARPMPISEADLFAAISRRRTRREPFARAYLPPALVDHLAAVAAVEGAMLVAVPAGHRRAVLDAQLSRAEVDAAEDLAHRAGLRAGWSHGTATTPIEVLCTEADDASAWLSAGQALQHVLLTATTAWIQARMFSLALEHPAQRAFLRDQVCNGSYPQVVLELGSVTELPGRDDPRADGATCMA